MSGYRPMGPELIGYVREYRNATGSSLREARAAVEAGWRPGQEPSAPDPRDAEIASLRKQLFAKEAEVERAKDEADKRFAAQAQAEAAYIACESERDEARASLACVTGERDEAAHDRDFFDAERQALLAQYEESQVEVDRLRSERAALRETLRVISELPMPEQDNMLSASMRRLAIAALRTPETKP